VFKDIFNERDNSFSIFNSMRGFLKKAGSLAVWAALALYIAWAARECRSRVRDLPARGVAVTVRDSAVMGVITPGMVSTWIASAGLVPPNAAASEIPVARIERLVRSRGYVRDASVYTGLDGMTHVELSQRRPVVRFNTSTGYNFCVTQDGWVLPLQPHAPMLLPIVTGDYTPPFERDYVGPLPGAKKNMDENYRFLQNLINFVEFINGDGYWSAQVEQINVIAGPGIGVYDPQIEIVPRVGNHVVMLGGLDNYRAGLEKLQRFYRHALRYEGWDRYTYINLKYKDQIVCK
jgi:cell division protein FtsQ